MPLAPHQTPKRPRRTRLVGISVSGLSPALLAKLERRAKLESRSVSNMIVTLLAGAVEVAESKAA